MSIEDRRWWGLSYAKVKNRKVSTTLTKALKADTDKHREDLTATALQDAKGIVAALEKVLADGP